MAKLAVDFGSSTITEQKIELRRPPSTFERVQRAFRRSPLAMTSLLFVTLVVLMALAAPLIGRYDPTATDLSAFEQPPSSDHWLGTDNAGLDVWSRLIWGSRNSLFVGVVAVLVSITIGIIIGAISGFYRGTLDAILMRVTDAFLSMPDIVLLLMLASILGASILNVVIIIGFLGWMGVARLIRGQFLSLREQEWALAARSVGVRDWRIIRRHMLPHVISPIVVSATFGVGGAIIFEASLSYLGMGVKPPAPSWGSMLSSAQSVHVLEAVWWSWLAPGITLVLVVLAVSYIGDTLRRSLDPQSRL